MIRFFLKDFVADCRVNNMVKFKTFRMTMSFEKHGSDNIDFNPKNIK